jgi:glycosyltransferase involved in cell wall biosynthesis
MSIPRRPASDLRVALLTNSLSPHSLSLCESISERLLEFRAFISEAVDKYHDFPPVSATFTIEVQRSFNFYVLFRKAYGFWQRSELHIPYDTLRQLKVYRPDVILSVQLGLRTVLAIAYKRRNPEVKIILWATLSERTEQNRNLLRRLIRLWIVRRIDAAFVNGASGEAYLRQINYTGKCFKIPYAIEDTLFRPEGYAPQNGVRRLFYAGQLVPQKGLRSFSFALNKWCAAHPDMQIVFSLAGDGPEKDILLQTIKASNLKTNLYGKMPQAELAKLYKSADMFAFPTLGDEWGVVINEAMIAGLPVLGSIHSQAVVEMVEEGKSGWMFDPDDPNDTYDALDRALSTQPEKLKLMSETVQGRVAELSPRHVGDRAVKALEWVANATGTQVMGSRSHRDTSEGVEAQ